MKHMRGISKAATTSEGELNAQIVGLVFSVLGALKPLVVLLATKNFTT